MRKISQILNIFIRNSPSAKGGPGKEADLVPKDQAGSRTSSPATPSPIMASLTKD